MRHFALWISAGLAITAIAWPAHAEKLTVTQYGRVLATLPWAVALEKGMFKEAGLDIDGITAGSGGGTSVRNVLASGLPFGDVSTSAALAAERAGVDIKIVALTSDHIGELAWVSKPESGIKSIKDLAGKTIAFTAPRSVTEMIVRTALEREGLTGKVEAVALGGLGPALTALSQDAVYAAPLNDPALTTDTKKYRLLFYSYQYFPKFGWEVCVTTSKFAKEHPETVRGLIAVHRKAVDFMYANRDETAAIYAKVWNISLDEAKLLLPKYYDWGHWARGDFSKEGLQAVEKGLLTVGEITAPVDWSKIIDQEYLPDELKRPL